MLSHVVLPQAKGRTDYPAKYADTAVTHMQTVLESRGAGAGKLVAKIVGGACMFGNGAATRIGAANVPPPPPPSGPPASASPARKSAAPAGAASRSTLPPAR